jgi:hypothetical protein
VFNNVLICLTSKESCAECAIMYHKGMKKKQQYFDFHAKYSFCMVIPNANRAKEDICGK